MAEWSNAAVLKTVDLHGSGGSNPSLSAKVQKKAAELVRAAFFMRFGSAPPQAGRDVGAERRNPGERRMSSSAGGQGCRSGATKSRREG